MAYINNQFKRIGGEVKQTTSGAVVRNAQSNLQPATQGSEYNQIGFVSHQEGISTQKFNLLVSFFEKKGISESLARTYGAAILDAAISSGKDVTDIIDLNENKQYQYDNNTLGHLNYFRGKTSQLGYNLGGTNSEFELLKRTVL